MNVSLLKNSFRASPADSPLRRAFTITELLVVIIIFVLVIGLAIPAFKSMLESSERSLAENQLRVGLSSARDAAIQSPTNDAAAVFFFTPGDAATRAGKITIVSCVSVGFLDDDEYSGNTATGRSVRREVFVPLGTTAPIQLPRSWSVRGYTPPNTLSSSDTMPSADTNGWYDSFTTSAPVSSDDPASVGCWVFPETGFYNPALAPNVVVTTGWQRQSFMVRFKSGTGSLDTGNRSLALVVDPIAAQAFRDSTTGVSPYNLPKFNLGQSTDLVNSVRRLLAATGLSAADQANRIKVLGDRSIDTVLVRPVTELAVYNERVLSAALAQTKDIRGLNRETGTFYLPASASTQTVGPSVDPALVPSGEDLFTVTSWTGDWIEGRLRRNSAQPPSLSNQPVESDARIFTLQRYLGQMQELTD